MRNSFARPFYCDIYDDAGIIRYVTMSDTTLLCETRLFFYNENANIMIGNF